MPLDMGWKTETLNSSSAENNKLELEKVLKCNKYIHIQAFKDTEAPKVASWIKH